MTAETVPPNEPQEPTPAPEPTTDAPATKEQPEVVPPWAPLPPPIKGGGNPPVNA